MSEEVFQPEYEWETKAVHFCVVPSRRYINLSYAWGAPEEGSISLTVSQALELREWLDTVLPRGGKEDER